MPVLRYLRWLKSLFWKIMPPLPDPEILTHPVILWFRQDLRLTDNPALLEALAQGSPILPVFIFDDSNPQIRHPGGASLWWLGQSLRALDGALGQLGARLHIFRGPAQGVLDAICQATGARQLFWNRRHDTGGKAQDTAIKAHFQAAGLDVRSFNANLLYEPWEVRSLAGEPYKVFTPFWRSARATRDPAPARPAPDAIPYAPPPPLPFAATLESLKLHPAAPDWSGGLAARFQPGEAGAKARLAQFLEKHLQNYATDRDFPGLDATSRLSPHLHFGEISPQLVWQAAQDAVASGRSAATPRDLEKFLAEMGWREFSYHLQHYYPDLATRNFQPRFDGFRFVENAAGLRAWQRGLTGYPIVDAGMRELWQTGYMHNRVRMIAASFLIKHLMVDWRMGEAWFWDTLCDADSASNAASWQWVAGSGADAAPYFRIFNPILQGEKFDGDGAYIARYVPELAGLPPRFIHKPWTAPASILASAGVRLGRNYPAPIVDHDQARQHALAAFQALGAATAE